MMLVLAALAKLPCELVLCSHFTKTIMAIAVAIGLVNQTKKLEPTCVNILDGKLDRRPHHICHIHAASSNDWATLFVEWLDCRKKCIFTGTVEQR